MRFLTCAVVVSGAVRRRLPAPVRVERPRPTSRARRRSSRPWTTAQLANETIAIPVEATNIGGLAPAARAGYGGILLFGTTAPASMPRILATLQRERPGSLRLDGDDRRRGWRRRTTHQHRRLVPVGADDGEEPQRRADHGDRTTRGYRTARRGRQHRPRARARRRRSRAVSRRHQPRRLPLVQRRAVHRGD